MKNLIEECKNAKLYRGSKTPSCGCRKCREIRINVLGARQAVDLIEIQRLKKELGN